MVDQPPRWAEARPPPAAPFGLCGAYILPLRSVKENGRCGACVHSWLGPALDKFGWTEHEVAKWQDSDQLQDYRIWAQHSQNVAQKPHVQSTSACSDARTPTPFLCLGRYSLSHQQ